VNDSRPTIQFVCNHMEVFLAVHREVSFLRQILPEQPVEIFARSSLPRTMWVTEINLYPSPSCQLSVSRHLFTLVVGQGLSHWFLSNTFKSGTKYLKSRFCRSISQLSQHHQSRASLDQYTHCGPVPRTFNQITLPMPRECTVVRFWRSDVNTQNSGNCPLRSSPLARSIRLL
jgi:hypothetical protein